VTVLATSFFQDHQFIEALYIVAFTLFILGLRGLSGPTTAPAGNRIAALGMSIAFIATLLIPDVITDFGDVVLMGVGIGVGTAIGIPAARSVKMTAMPQMVALFNGVGGGAVALIAWVEYRRHFPEGGELWSAKAQIPSLFAAIIGSISFWGSNIAFGKLQEILPGRPIKLPGQQIINGLLGIVAVGTAVVLAAGVHSQALFIVGILLAAAILGNLIVLPIGGADMPVVISLLNAFTGVSAAATGIALDNTALIVAGTLVGASGSILTNLMAVAMNRSVPAIVAGGFGGGGTAAAAAEGDEDRQVRSTTADDVAIQLSYAQNVVVVPGYGMAVAQAQHAVRELEDELEKRGVHVDYAIHPVAGRMPGHMNVLLAEANVSYDRLREMDDINPDFPTTDVSLVIGANDVTNPAAREQTDSPIYGMPILDVDKSEQVIVLKRSMNTGFAGIDNPLFYKENTSLLFGDAKESIQQVLSEVKKL
jgi:NAD(P) transhydrogenase subunit beta